MNNWVFILKDRILKEGLRRYKAFPKQKDYGLENPEGTALLNAIITVKGKVGYGLTTWSDAKDFLIECFGIKDIEQATDSFFVTLHLNKFHFGLKVMDNE